MRPALPPLLLAALLLGLPAPASGQGHDDDHGPAGYDADVGELENATADDPTGVLASEIRRARAEARQWSGRADVAAARAEGVLGTLAYGHATGRARGDFVSFALDVANGTWRDLAVSARAGQPRAAWLAAVQAQPFTHPHGPLVAGPTLRLFCEENAWAISDAPSAPLVARAALETEVRLVAAQGVEVAQDGPRSFLLANGTSHAHVLFTRGSASLDGATMRVTLLANETLMFRVHQGPAAGPMHEANAALALRQLKAEAFAYPSEGKPLSYTTSWGATLEPAEVGPERAQWRVADDAGAPLGVRVVHARWALDGVQVLLDGVPVANASAADPPRAPGMGVVTLSSGTIDAWIAVPAGEHTLAFAPPPEPARETTPAAPGSATPARETPLPGWLALLGLALALRRAQKG